MSKEMLGRPPNIGAGESLTDLACRLALFGERKIKVVWDISNKCNLRCRMCHFGFDDVFYRPAEYTSPDDFRRMATSVLPHAHTLILSAGNEPLTSPFFIDLLRIASEYHVPELSFITNGQRLDERVIEAILKYNVTQVQVSIDGPSASTYEYVRRGGSFNTLVRNLARLRDRKAELGKKIPRVQFNIVLMRSNIEELPNFVDLAEELGVEWIAARHLIMVRGLQMENETLSHIPEKANQYFRAFLDRADRSSTVSVVAFPDFFGSATACSQSDEVTSRGVGPNEQKLLRRFARRVAAKFTNHKTPFGYVDSPAASDVHAQNAVHFEGWALDRKGLSRISLEREALPGEPRTLLNERGLIRVCDVAVINGSRPDVGAAFPGYPNRSRAGWSVQLRREMISQEDEFEASLHVIAFNIDGETAEIAKRRISFSTNSSAAPYLYCARPFDSVYITSSGAVYPYPDCRVKEPFGSLKDEGSFQDIWFGEPFTELRSRIIKRDPPPMCLSCAHFINRNVDDASYFTVQGK
ncbi:MoaA/NifB/PqqE/SkfB family radical SAM enzyme [Bradyrhizobium sp. S3.12.5]|uniref:radical SAM protein n=1 Tax=Bradyrhizobium sp. S3.12.5 TaxID=3156386 RepID=UPI00339278D8